MSAARATGGSSRLAPGNAEPPGAAEKPLALFSGADVTQLALDCFGYIATGLIPASQDARLASVLNRFYVPRRTVGVAEIAERMTRLLGPGPGGRGWCEEARANIEMQIESEWGRWRALHRRGWRIESQVDGIEVLADAKKAGSRVILWGMAFCGSLAPKVCLWDADIRVAHLSDWKHGPPPPYTRLGLRALAPIHRAAENRYLAQRVVIQRGNSITYLKILKRLLEEKRLVSIAGEMVAPRRNIDVRILNRHTQLATGAPALAWSTGAVLLPLCTSRIGPNHYRAAIQKPVSADRSNGKRRFVQEAVEEFAHRIDEQVRLHPSDWGWTSHTARRLLDQSG